jgi:hypothetical protein
MEMSWQSEEEVGKSPEGKWCWLGTRVWTLASLHDC